MSQTNGVKCKFKGSDGCTPSSCPGVNHCKAYERARYQARKDKIAARGVEYRKENKEVLTVRKHNYYAANRETILEKVKVYTSEHKDEKLARDRKRHHENYIPVGDIKALMHEDGSITRMRSMSEVYFFSMLEEEGVAYEYEVKLSTPMGVYIADGFLPELNIYVEVKADHYVRDDQMAKINYLREHGYSIIMIDSNLIDGEFGF